MKIAYLIAAHKNAGQVVRLIEQLDCEDAIFAIHIDKKSPFNVYDEVTSALNANKNIILLERLRVTEPGGQQGLKRERIKRKTIEHRRLQHRKAAA